MKTNDKCPYCGAAIELVDSSVIYGRSYGPVYICTQYPKCDTYVGCHKGTEKPFGTLADYKLREHRKTAHLLFDRLWKSKLYKRKEAYRLLKIMIGVDDEHAHIAMLDLSQCQLLIKKISENFWEGKWATVNVKNAERVVD